MKQNKENSNKNKSKSKKDDKDNKIVLSGLEKLASSTLTQKWLQTAMGNNDIKRDNHGNSKIDSLNNVDKEIYTETNSKNNLKLPIFLSGHNVIDYCSDSRLSTGAMQIVQEEGDLILIPPYYWHQVYHLEPSIAIASQYINDVGKDRSFKHIIRWCKGEGNTSKDNTDRKGEKKADKFTDTYWESLLPGDFKTMSNKEQVLTVIKTGLHLQHGRIRGSTLMRKLLANSEKTD